MATITTTCSTSVTRVTAGQKAARPPMTPAYAALLPQSQGHGEAMGTGVFGGTGLFAAEFFVAPRAEVTADAKPNARTGRLPRDRQPV